MCFFHLTHARERFKRPLVSNDWALFANADDLRRPKNLEEVRNAVFGSYIGDAIVKYLEDKKIKIEVARTDEINPEKLLSKHIDFWATGRLIGQYILKKKNIKGIIPIMIFNHSDMYLGCNKTLPDNLVIRLNETLRKMRIGGEIKKIYHQHGYEP